MNFTQGMLLDLRRLTLNDISVRADVLAGRYRRLTPEIAIWEETWEQLPPWERARARDHAFGMSADRAILCGASAARIHGLAVAGAGRMVEMTYLNRNSVRARKFWPPWTVFRSAGLRRDEVCVVEGIRVTAVSRTLRDVARYHGLAAGVVAIDDARRKDSALTIDSLHRTITAGQSYHGVGTVRRAIDLSVSNSDSPLESQARVILVTAAVGMVQAQVVITVRGRAYRVDLLIDGWLIIEIDGNVKYDGVTFGKAVDDVLRAERHRETQLQNAGFVVIRVKAADLVVRPDGGCTLLDLVRAAQGRRHPA